MTPQNNDFKIAQLEQQLHQALRQLADLSQRVSYLERENSRRKSEVGQIASAINRG
jgi:regulator of replication initiation timing